MAALDHLIDPATGEPDAPAVIRAAKRYATREWGDDNYPPNYLRKGLEWCHERASAERLAWRRDHGLADDVPGIVAGVPAWGASGDSFGGR